MEAVWIGTQPSPRLQQAQINEKDEEWGHVKYLFDFQDWFNSNHPHQINPSSKCNKQINNSKVKISIKSYPFNIQF